MSKESLDRPNVVICLKQMRGKTVAEGMTRDALRELRPPDGLVERLLDVCGMKMIPPPLLRVLHERQRLLREQPLPNEILRGPRIFLFELVIYKHPRKPCREIFVVARSYGLKLRRQLQHDRLRNRHRPVFIPRSMDRKNSGVEIEILHPHCHAFEETKPAAIQQFDRKIIGRHKVFHDGIDFLARKNHGDICRFLCAGNILVIAKVFLQNMPVHKQQGVERLILR